MGAGGLIVLEREKAKRDAEAAAAEVSAAIQNQPSEVRLASNVAVEEGAESSALTQLFIELLTEGASGAAGVRAKAFNEVARRRNLEIGARTEQGQSEKFQTDLLAAQEAAQKQTASASSSVFNRARTGPQTLFTRPGQIPRATRLGE